MIKNDLTGQVFGRLEVICFSHRDTNRNRYWTCKCECGTEKTIVQYSFTSGHTKSCGCLHKEALIERNKSHNMSDTTEYSIWKGMKKRCSNPKEKCYKDYGGRGIRVCDRWLENFENFYEDMGPRPSKKHTIERVDNDGNYCPENCKWATRSEQQRNQRVRGGISYYGVIDYDHKFRAIVYIDKKQVHLGYFDTTLQAATAYDDAYEEIYGIRRNNTEVAPR